MTLYMPLFKACTTLRSLTLLHAHLTITGLQKDPLASTKLIESYSQMGSVQTSRLVFDRFPNPDSFMWGNSHPNPSTNKEPWIKDEELAFNIANGNRAESHKTDLQYEIIGSAVKELYMYIVSALFSKFQGLPVVSHPNHSAVSSSSKAHLNSAARR
ncbi:putative pentatricopeptide repeat-containing protein, mitochondrial [Sesamum alatum]|uniref:Pentatricopeptide repeat-containing protein, mitochondrial n=1 Tax=Sesamum alatum TaxID=300844 RepID=A0AAE1YHQ9_9LAMI|nr:putative pentatricopeptide repeat-containing protein, mitochondrial [Sesamum alatum]